MSVCVVLTMMDQLLRVTEQYIDLYGTDWTIECICVIRNGCAIIESFIGKLQLYHNSKSIIESEAESKWCKCQLLNAVKHHAWCQTFGSMS